MHGVIMDNHCTNNESNKNNIENAKEAITTVEEMEDKGKKANACVQLTTGQKKSAAIDIFMYSCSGTSPSFSVNLSRRNTMFFKKGSHPIPQKVTAIVHARFGRQLLNYVIKHKWSISPSEQKILLHKTMITKMYFKHIRHEKSASGQVNKKK